LVVGVRRWSRLALPMEWLKKAETVAHEIGMMTFVGERLAEG
jgi:hypothetical protein